MTKRVVEVLANCFVILPVASYRLWATVVGARRAFYGWSQLFSLLPGKSGDFMRRSFYQFILSSCGQDVCVSFGTVFSHPTVRLGHRVYIGVGCMLGDVTLEDDVLIGSHVSIINGRRQHDIERLDIPVRDQPGEYPRVVIGKDCWIGDRAIVTADLGNHCVVGAGSVVTKAVPDFAIVVGNPARITGFRKASGKAASTPPAVDIPTLTTAVQDADVRTW